MSFMRQEPERVSELVVILNLTPVPRHKYRVGLPRPGKWLEVLNSDAATYGGSNVGNMGGVMSEDLDCHNQSYSAEFTLPPMSILVFKPEQAEPPSVVEMETIVEDPSSKPPTESAGEPKPE
jgi:1,4-alpha-glucan branching enzyme